jgi:hypothetical protein
MSRRSRDYSEIRIKVQRAAAMIAEGASENRAAKEVGLPKASLQRYLKKGLPDGPIWPSEEQTGPHNGPPEKEDHPAPSAFGPLPDQRDFLGRFLPGNQFGEIKNRPAREAKRKLEEFAPKVADKLIRVFDSLPEDRPDLVLAYAKEILDRSLGRPTQTLDITETSIEQHEYKFIQEIILHDEEALRLAVAFSQCLEGHARNDGAEAEPRQMAALPAPE